MALSSGVAAADGTVTVDLILTFPAGASATAAVKSLSCASTSGSSICVLARCH
ncbi:MAG: hypothetical protein LAQ30_14250 [Acidobacteriia bacterium]|nr:hypothetical protein [Terriglobia bacterium]